MAHKIKLGVISKIKNLKELLEKELKVNPEVESKLEVAILNPSFDAQINPNEIEDVIRANDILLADPLLIAPFMSISNFEKYPYIENIKWVQSTWAGVNTLLYQNFQSTNTTTQNHPKYILTRMAGIFGDYMADYCVGSICTMERHFHHYHELQKLHQWETQGGRLYRKLSDVTVGIFGVGDIANGIAKVLKNGFGMQVWGLRRSPVSCSVDTSGSNFDRMLDRSHMMEFLNGVDYFINTLPATHETYHMLSGDVLKNCKPESVFINVGRGNIIDETSIENAINNHWIRGAVLDVFEQEPLPSTSKLWDLPNVVITPHVSALSMAEDMVKVFIMNFREYFTDPKKLKYQVDWNRGY